MIPIVDFISNAGKHYEAVFYSCLPKERQEFIEDSIQIALQFKRKAFKCKNVNNNILHCAYQSNKKAIILLIKDNKDKEILNSLAVILD